MPAVATHAGSPAQKVRSRSFFEQQRRHRTRAKSWAALIGVLGCLMAWSFGFIVVGALELYANLLSRLLPHQVTQRYADVMNYAGGLIGVGVAAALFTAGLWWFARRILMRDTSAGLIWRTRAQLSDGADAEEQPFVNEAMKMAAAAGAPMPAVLVFEGPTINAAVIGDGPEGAGILVSRELLKTLNLEERQGVIAHLLASAINGDLAINGALLRVFYMAGIALTLLDLPFSPHARQTISLLWRYAWQSDQQSAAVLGDDVGPTLSRVLQPDGLESLTIIVRRLIGEETDLRSIGSTLLLVPLFPFFLLRVATGVLYGLTSLLLLSPLAALLLRSRRKGADATAVHFTHHPDGLARALIHLYGSAHAFVQAGYSEINFIVGHDEGNAPVFDRLKTRIAEAITTADNFNLRLRDRTPAVANPSATAQPERGVAGHNFVFGFHPPLGLRIASLKKSGGTVKWSDQNDYSSWIIAGVLVGVIGAVLLLVPW
jgi:Zn-dependent protease with chaperone function